MFQRIVFATAYLGLAQELRRDIPERQGQVNVPRTQALLHLDTRQVLRVFRHQARFTRLLCGGDLDQGLLERASGRQLLIRGRAAALPLPFGILRRAARLRD